MWSKEEHINTTINCLLFLLAINFLHLGQLLLPLICLIIFIDNKCKFFVNNIYIFVVLCLFGITFFMFSYTTGFYSTMGFCLPMAYYIGSNIKKKDEKNLINTIYLIVFGMATHLLLNFIFELVIDGFNMFNSVNHYDVWTGDYIPTTSTATNCIMIISLFYYLLLKEKNIKTKTIGLVLFAIVVLYDLALGRRTPLLLGILCFAIALFIDLVVVKNRNVDKKPLIATSFVLLFIFIIFICIYEFNLFSAKKFILSLGLVKKMMEYGLDTGRLDIFFKAIKLMPSHLWGGQEIHDILGIQVHDLWMDTFDYAGVIPFILLIAHSAIYVLSFVRLLKHPSISKSFKLFVLVLFIGITIQLFLEPIMSGSSLFIIIVVLIEAVLENKVVYEK